MDRLENLVQNKTIGVMLHGKSIEELENRIELFKNLDIVWVSLNAFDIMETYILNKINKKLDIIFCLAHFWPEIEKNIRIPALINAIKNGTLVIAKKYLFDSIFPESKFPDIYDQYEKSILLIEDIINQDNKSLADILLVYTVSSLGYILCVLSILKAKQIILFGCDGALFNDLNSYYKSERLLERRVVFPNKLTDYPDGYLISLKSDTEILNTDFFNTYLTCMNKFNMPLVPILNCSPNSYITAFPLITYDNLLKEYLCL